MYSCSVESVTVFQYSKFFGRMMRENQFNLACFMFFFFFKYVEMNDSFVEKHLPITILVFIYLNSGFLSD